MKKYADYRKTSSPFLKTVPSHWIDVKLRHCYTIKSISNTSNEPLLSVFLNRGVVSYTDTDMKQVHKPSEDMKAYQLVLPGDFVLNNQQAWRGSVGVSSHRGIVSPAYIVMAPITENNPRFMNYMLRETACISQFVLASKGVGSIQRILSPIKLKSSIVVLPPRDEQDQIVRYLDWQVSKINRLIAAKRKQIELMKDNLKSAVAKLTTHGIGSHDMCRSEIYWLTEYPSTWHVTKLKYILKKHRREVPPNAELLICSNSGEVTKRGDGKLWLVAASDDIYQGVKTGDLLIHGMDTWHGAIAISNFDGMCTPVVHVCTCREEKRFVAYYLKMMAYTKVFKAISNGVRQNTSDFRSWDKVGDLLICLPDISEQVAIADELDKLTDATKKGIACFERHIEKLVDLRTRLISDVVTGQIDVRGIEIPEYSVCDENASIDQETEEDLCEQGDE